MLDQYGRIIDYMRISLTDRCNLRCIYCMPEEGICQIPRTEVLSEDEILRVCSLASELGISRIKLTGGEPLVRRICVPLVKELKALPGIQQVTLTTNGILLKEQLPGLMEAGLDAVNISLDTLDAETFRKITRRDELKKVLEGLEAALSYPELKVKVNCVLLFRAAGSFAGGGPGKGESAPCAVYRDDAHWSWKRVYSERRGDGKRASGACLRSYDAYEGNPWKWALPLLYP